MFTYLLYPYRLPARVGAFEHHSEQVRRKSGITESGRPAKADDTLVFPKLVLLHDAPRRMVRIGQLCERVAEGRAALFHRPKLGRGTPAPVLKLTLRVPPVLLGEVLPVLFLVGDDPLTPFRYQLVLRVEVAIERHLVGLRRLGDRFDPDAPDALFVKQVPPRDQNPRANRHGRAVALLRFDPVIGSICFHDMLYPPLT